MDQSSDFLEGDKSKNYKGAANKNYIFWRLVFEGGMKYNEVKLMDVEEILEANAALDIYLNKLKKQWEV